MEYLTLGPILFSSHHHNVGWAFVIISPVKNEIGTNLGNPVIAEVLDSFVGSALMKTNPLSQGFSQLFFGVAAVDDNGAAYSRIRITLLLLLHPSPFKLTFFKP